MRSRSNMDQYLNVSCIREGYSIQFPSRIQKVLKQKTQFTFQLIKIQRWEQVALILNKLRVEINNLLVLKILKSSNEKLVCVK